jgi:hypothetical protein
MLLHIVISFMSDRMDDNNICDRRVTLEDNCKNLTSSGREFCFVSVTKTPVRCEIMTRNGSALVCWYRHLPTYDDGTKKSRNTGVSSSLAPRIKVIFGGGRAPHFFRKIYGGNKVCQLRSNVQC